MALRIETFVNPSFGASGGPAAGGRTLFKALGHPLAADRAPDLLTALRGARRLAVYDPLGHLELVDQFYPLAGLAVERVYVQRLEDLGRPLLGHLPVPVSDFDAGRHDRLLVAAFQADPLLAQIRHLLPPGLPVSTLDALALPEAMLSDRRDYLAGLNFATNFAFFRDEAGQHTRVVGANYWSVYGAEAPALWLRLFDADGRALATWEQPLPPAGGTFVLDSREVRARCGLGDFCGSLFIHAVRVRGHEVVKYALDTYGDDEATLSCSHDANAWPADFYAGVPAPRPGERVLLWVQNSHPVPIPAGAVALNPMGAGPAVAYPEEIAPFATRAVDCGALLPGLAWPAQIEVAAGKHFVRPRYEVVAGNRRRRLAHANVERVDLAPNPQIPALMEHLGKGYIMPLPVLPVAEFASQALPTPMARGQAELPLKALLVDAAGRTVAERFLGRLARDRIPAIDVDRWLEEEGLDLPSGYGHLELVYDFRDGGTADGWLHALGRYEQRASGHGADTSFGSHLFNMPITYRDEPQSYAGRAPGLSTRLFLRLAADGADTLCHLIYPASRPWHGESQTELRLIDAGGSQLTAVPLAIPCGGSRFLRMSELFEPAALQATGPGGYVQIRDATCRLFGYHGLLRPDVTFSLDHMFGF